MAINKVVSVQPRYNPAETVCIVYENVCAQLEENQMHGIDL